MRGEGSEFYGIREYQPGDPLRRVHWRSSARMGRLAVVEYEHDVSVDLTLVLDARRGSVLGVGTETTMEAAATVAASLAQLVLQRGNRCRLAIPGVPVPRLADSRGVDALYGIFEALARVEAEQSETAADAVAALLPELERHATLALITAVWTKTRRGRSPRLSTPASASWSSTSIRRAIADTRRPPPLLRPPEGATGRRGDGRRQTRRRGGYPRRGSWAMGRPAKSEPVLDFAGRPVLPSPRPLVSASPHLPLSPSPLSGDTESIRAQILALRAWPVIIRHGADLAGQFALAAAGRR